MDLTLDQAKNILDLATECSVHDGSLPPTDAEVIELASEIVGHAVSAQRAGANSEAITAIIEAAKKPAPAPAEPAPIPMDSAAPETMSVGQARELLMYGTAFGINSDDALLVIQEALGYKQTALIKMPAHLFDEAKAALDAEVERRAAGEEPTVKDVPVSNGTPMVAATTPEEPEDPVETLDPVNAVGAVLWGNPCTINHLADLYEAAHQGDSETFPPLPIGEIAGILKALIHGGQAEIIGQYGGMDVFRCTGDTTANPYDRLPEPTDDEEPPFEPDPPKEQPEPEAEPAKRRRRVRASDGELVFPEDLEAYEQALKDELDASVAAGSVTADGAQQALEAAEAEARAEQEEIRQRADGPTTEDGRAIDPETGEVAEPASIMGAYRNHRERSILAEAKIRKERLPIPPEIHEEATPIPKDFTTLSDVELRRLHSEYHALHSRALWLLACERTDRDAARALRELAYQRVLAALGGEKVTTARAEAASNKEVQRWADLEAEHEAAKNRLEALASWYENTCVRISRDFSFRQAEREQAR